MERWRKAALWRRLTADKVALVALLGVWWFFLQRDDRVLNLVDTASYLTAVYSVWRVAGGIYRWSRQVGRGRSGAKLPNAATAGAEPPASAAKRRRAALRTESPPNSAAADNEVTSGSADQALPSAVGG
jgi:hypothetical protein